MEKNTEFLFNYSYFTNWGNFSTEIIEYWKLKIENGEIVSISFYDYNIASRARYQCIPCIYSIGTTTFEVILQKFFQRVFEHKESYEELLKKLSEDYLEKYFEKIYVPKALW